MTGILFIARLGSTRLPSKHLIECQGKVFLEWLIERYADQFKHEIANDEVKLFVATSVTPENKQFEKTLADQSVTVFYGNDENIPMRQLECADAFGLDAIISIDGDDILCSTEAARKVYEALPENNEAFIKTLGLPLGMNVMGYSTSFLKGALTQNIGKLETGWGRIFEGKKSHEIKLGDYSANTDLRLTLDYELDAKFFKAVITYFTSRIVTVSDKELIEVIIANRFFEINSSLSEEYAANFNKWKNSEINPS